MDDIRGRYSAERIARMVKLATAGGDVDKPLRAVVRSIVPLGPPGEYLRDELKDVRRAAKRRDSEGSIGRLVDLTRWAAGRMWAPELACMLSAVAMNLRNELAGDVRAEDAAALDYVAGKLAFDLLDYQTAAVTWRRALEAAEATEDRELVADLLLNLGNIARFQDRNEDAAQLVQAAAAEYERQADVTGRAQALLSLGYMAADANELDEAAYWLAAVEPLVKGRQAAGSRAGFHHLQAVLHVEAGELASAEASFKRSLNAARRFGDHDKVVTALQNLAAVASDAGNARLSLRRTRAATEAASEYRLLLRLTALLPTLVRAEAAHGNHGASLSAARALLEVAEATKHGVGEAHALLGASLIDNNLTEEGIAELEQAWKLLSGDAGRPAVQVRPHIVNNLTVAHSSSGSLDRAWQLLLQYATQLEPDEVPRAVEHLGIAMIDARLDQDDTADVLTDSLRLRPPAERAWAALQIGHHAYEAAQHDVAVKILDLALKTATRRGQVTTVRQIRNDLALSLVDTYRYRRADTLLTRNLTEAEMDGDSLTRSLALHNLAELSRRTENPEAAEQYGSLAAEAAKHMGDKGSEAAALLQVGMAQSDQGKYKQATRTLNRVLKLSKPGADNHGGALHSLAGISLGKGDAARAVELYREALKTEKNRPVAHAETLLGYVHALAATGNRRSYRGAMQKLVDALCLVPFKFDYAIRMTHIAREWSHRGRPTFAGEALALAVLVSATDAQNAFPLDPDARYPRLEGALYAVAAEVHYQDTVEQSTDRRTLLNAIRAELRNHTTAGTAREITSMLRDLVASLDD